MAKDPTNQNQHKVPQVYLKKFGYKTNSNQWKISVIKHGEKRTSQKSIKSFTAQTNVFDIDSKDIRILRMFEELNRDLENQYNNILTDIENDGSLTDKSYAMLLQLIANFICRSDYWRDWILNLLKHKNKESFLKSILGHLCKDKEEFKNLHKQPHFRILMDSDPDEILNRVLIYFTDYLYERLQHYDIVIIQSPEGKPWFSSTEPVVLKNRMKKFEFMNKDSEVYFPLSPNYLVYLHFSRSDDKENPLRNEDRNTIIEASDELIQNLMTLILSNPAEYVLIAGEFKYEAEKTSDPNTDPKS